MRLQVNSFILGRETNYLFEIGMTVVRMSTGTDKLRSQNEPKDLIVMENNGRGKH